MLKNMSKVLEIEKVLWQMSLEDRWEVARWLLDNLPTLPSGESVYDLALPVLKRAWARRGRGVRDLATNPR